MVSPKMKMLWMRIREIRKAILSFSIASIVDIFAISLISFFYEKVSEYKEIFLIEISIAILMVVIARTLIIFFLRKYAYTKILEKKGRDEFNLVKMFIQRRSSISPQYENNAITHFKEGLINSTQQAAVNFDLPMASLVGELLFACGGIMVLIQNMGFILLVAMLPVVVILLLIMRVVANKLRHFGSEVLRLTEERLSCIDNISEASLELCVAHRNYGAANYFNGPNSSLNQLINNQLSLSNSTQLIVESASFITILVCLIFIVLGIADITMGAAAASLAILARMIPTITRSIASSTQLHYGIPAVIKLHIYRYDVDTGKE